MGRVAGGRLLQIIIIVMFTISRNSRKTVLSKGGGEADDWDDI
jgi:hypothetical protein